MLAVGGATGFAVGQDGDERELTAAFDDVAGTDLDVLNYALSLENLESAYCREALETFTRDEFEATSVVSNYETGSSLSVYTAVETLAEHEATHVEVLSEAVTLLGGTPLEEASHEFELGSVEDFFALAAVFENTGVAAYAGAAPFIESPDLLGAASSIHSVEARHAAFLNDIIGTPFFPDAFDTAASQEEVLDAVSEFVDDWED